MNSAFIPAFFAAATVCVNLLGRDEPRLLHDVTHTPRTSAAAHVVASAISKTPTRTTLCILAPSVSRAKDEVRLAGMVRAPDNPCQAPSHTQVLVMLNSFQHPHPSVYDAPHRIQVTPLPFLLLFCLSGFRARDAACGCAITE